MTEYEWTIFGHFISPRKFTQFSPNSGLLFFKVCSLINHIKNLLHVLLRFIEHLIIIGRTVRIRSCKPNRQCLIGSLSSQSINCFANSCTINYRKKLNMIENNIMTHSPDYKSTKNNLNIIFIFLFPFLFTLLCIPLCVLYYIYELDFKIHALTIHILSKCQRHDETKGKRINIS